MTQTSCAYFFLAHHLPSTEFPPLPPLSLSSQGMVYSAEYIKKKLEQEMILSQAFGRDLVHDSVYCVKYGRLNDDPFYKNLYSVFLLASL